MAIASWKKTMTWAVVFVLALTACIHWLYTSKRVVHSVSERLVEKKGSRDSWSSAGDFEQTDQPRPNYNKMLRERIVHLDLKGAAPRPSYLLKLFPLLQQWGATGLLIEWEDMFPYNGELASIRQGESYRLQDVKSILDAAKSAGLRIIPLIQTLGHLEFVLKHQQYSHLREVPRIPQVFCPSYNVSLFMVESMIEQIMEVHRDYIDAIHIGADEAFGVAKECQRCQSVIEKLGSKDDLLLNYVTAVAKLIKKKYGVRVLMWNDMFERTPIALMKSYGMDRLVEPVIWGYAEDLMADDYFAEGVFERFGETYKHLWIGSAFKGANGPDRSFIDVNRYATNHASWLNLLARYQKSLQSVGGIIITGWQRFDHFAVLCELLPASIPSLVFNLELVKNGAWSVDLYDKTRIALNCGEARENWASDAPEWVQLIERFEIGSKHHTLPAPTSLGTLNCKFPGSELYGLIERLRLVRHDYEVFINTAYLRGWLSEYNQHHSYGNIHHAENAYSRCEALTESFSRLGESLRTKLSEIYYDDTVSEWLFENIQVYLNKLKDISRHAMTIMKSVSFRTRPLAHVPMDI